VEGLFILIAEMLLLPVQALAVAVFEFIISIFFTAAEVGVSAATSRSAKKQNRQDDTEVVVNERNPPPKTLKFMKWLKWILLSILVAIILMVVLINYFFLDSAVKYVLDNVKERSGVSVEYKVANGNLFTGRFELLGIVAKREKHDQLTFDLVANTLIIDLDLLSSAFGHAELEYLEIKDSSGKVERLHKSDKLKAKKPFNVEFLLIENLDIDYIDHTSDRGVQKYKFEVQDLSSKPFRSTHALFDVFFRSNMQGAINGYPFTIKTEVQKDGRITQWRANDLPVQIAGDFIGGPLKWLKSGKLDIHVDDAWAVGNNVDINMDWKFIFKGVNAEAPDHLNGMVGTLSNGAVNYLNSRPDPSEVSFRLVVNENQFEGATSLEAAGMWKAVTKSLLNKITAGSKEKQQAIKENVKKGFDKFKGFIDKRRKGEKGEN
jgi:hypothetical protein